MEVTSKPDIRKFMTDLDRQLKIALLDSAKMVINDNASRIQQRVAWDGGAQQENSDKPPGRGYRSRKAWRLGHTVPLRADEELLITQSGYRIDGQKRDSAPLPSQLRVIVELPKERVEAIKGLRRYGYRYWGLSREVIARIRTHVASAFAIAQGKQRSVPLSGMLSRF